MPAKKATEVDTKENERLHQNMRFYGLVQDTPKEAQKEFNNGKFSGTDINPMWRIKKLTEIFGPSGFGWWTQNVSYRFVESPETKEIAVFCELELIVKDPDTGEVSQPIYGVGGNIFVASRKSGLQSSDEAMKMAYTDAVSIACKALGFSHDIYFAKDRTKYTAYATGETGEAANDEPTPEQFKAITDRIQKGIALVTKNMDSDAKAKFTQDVVVKNIGQVNYMTCKDLTKLNALLEELLAMAKKAA